MNELLRLAKETTLPRLTERRRAVPGFAELAAAMKACDEGMRSFGIEVVEVIGVSILGNGEIDIEIRHYPCLDSLIDPRSDHGKFPTVCVYTADHGVRVSWRKPISKRPLLLEAMGSY